MGNLLLKSLATWLIIAVLANINGAIRQYMIIPWSGEKAGHIISTIMLSAIVFVVSYFFVKSQAERFGLGAFALVGLLWLILTLAFEFGFGHYVFKKPWETLLADYRIWEGRIWPLVLLSTLLAPIIWVTALKK